MDPFVVSVYLVELEAFHLALELQANICICLIDNALCLKDLRLQTPSA